MTNFIISVRSTKSKAIVDRDLSQWDIEREINLTVTLVDEWNYYSVDVSSSDRIVHYQFSLSRALAREHDQN